MRYEYHVIPAPAKGQKEKGAKSSEARYAVALAAVLNEQAARGWIFVRAETLPMVERKGLWGSHTTYVSSLIFRREIDELTDEATEEAIRLIGHPEGRISGRF